MANYGQLRMSPHIIGSGLFLVTQGTYGDIMVKELVCRLRVLGSAIYVHDLTGLSRQNGFLKNNSCVMNLTALIESLSTNLLQDLPTDIIYFDFAKAFDTVNHDLILSKLKYQYSIDGRMLKFFKSYLCNA